MTAGTHLLRGVASLQPDPLGRRQELGLGRVLGQGQPQVPARICHKMLPLCLQYAADRYSKTSARVRTVLDGAHQSGRVITCGGVRMLTVNRQTVTSSKVNSYCATLSTFLCAIS